MLIIYILLVCASALFRLPIAKLLCKIYDTGTTWYYTPGIIKEHSVAFEGRHFYTHNPRVRIATWIIYPLIPIYWIVQFFFIARYVFCLMDDFFSYGEFEKKLLRQAPEIFPEYYKR